MAISRRGFFDVIGAGGRPADSGAFLSARGLEAHLATGFTQDPATGTRPQGRGQRPALPPGVEEIKINSNENPLGPGKTVLDALVAHFGETNRYPFNSSPKEGDLTDAVAAKNKVKAENVVLAVGSQEILKNAVRAFCSPARGLVAGAPTFENCTGFARKMKFPVAEIKVDSAFKLNVEDMIAMSRGAGLIFFNNPNNPTATVHGLKVVTDFVERVRRISPDTVILIDEAYHDYVTDPSYETAIPLAMATPNVFVARTFSKAYGMAGMRIGYAIGQPDSVKPLARLRMPNSVSVLGVAATTTSLADQKHIDDERARNTEVRAFTVKALTDLGCKPTDSQANFLFVDIGRPAKEFRDACAKQGVMVGRDFPPFENSHCRISIGTMAEMQKSAQVFRDVLRPMMPAANAGKSGGGSR
jgi:histidinol-phosphate aminotransferase